MATPPPDPMDKIACHQMRWPEWKEMKSRLLEVAKGYDLLLMLRKLIGQLPELAKLETSGKTPKEVGTELLAIVGAESLDEVVGTICDAALALDDLTEILIRGCCDIDPAELQSLPAVDVLSLRAKALEVADLEGMLRAEKNSLPLRNLLATDSE